MKKGLHMETGHPVTANVQQVEGDCIRFVDQDGKCVFEVSITQGQPTIEVRAVDFHKSGHQIHSGMIVVRPDSSNKITISTPPYK